MTDDLRLPASVRAAIGDEANAIYISAASALEMATKHRPGKLDGAADAIRHFAELVAADGFEHLPVTYAHALRETLKNLDPVGSGVAISATCDGLPSRFWN